MSTHVRKEVRDMNDREWLHRYAELIDEADLADVKMVMQQYAARALNRKYREDMAHGKSQADDEA